MSASYRYDADQQRYIRRPAYEMRQMSNEQFMAWVCEGWPGASWELLEKDARAHERLSSRIYSADQDDESLLEGEKAGRWRITDDGRWERVT